MEKAILCTTVLKSHCNYFGEIWLHSNRLQQRTGWNPLLSQPLPCFKQKVNYRLDPPLINVAAKIGTKQILYLPQQLPNRKPAHCAENLWSDSFLFLFCLHTVTLTCKQKPLRPCYLLNITGCAAYTSMPSWESQKLQTKDKEALCKKRNPPERARKLCCWYLQDFHTFCSYT